LGSGTAIALLMPRPRLRAARRSRQTNAGCRVGHRVRVGDLVEGVAEQQLLDRQFHLLARQGARNLGHLEKISLGTWRAESATLMRSRSVASSCGVSSWPGRITTNSGM
jgi:hypothetical protein